MERFLICSLVVFVALVGAAMVSGLIGLAVYLEYFTESTQDKGPLLAGSFLAGVLTLVAVTGLLDWLDEIRRHERLKGAELK